LWGCRGLRAGDFGMGGKVVYNASADFSGLKGQKCVRVFGGIVQNIRIQDIL